MYTVDEISAIVPCLWVDDSFVDMTATCLKGLKGLGETIVVNAQRGYAANVNVGLKTAKGRVLLICNNDIEFIQPDWLEHLLKPLEDGYWVSSIRTSDSDGWETEDKITKNDKFGSIWAMNRTVYEIVGGLDESFGKGLFEDLDYWRRVRDYGFSIGKNHAGLVEHKGKATFKAVDPNDDQFGKNMFVYKQKWGDKAHIIETKPDHILLLDEYELEEYTPFERKEMLKNEVSLEEAKRRWNVTPVIT